MPTYEFYCEKCKKNFSIVLSISDYDKKKYVRPKDKKTILGLRFRINKKNSIINYARHIGFDTKDKNIKLEQAVRWASNVGG